MGSGVWIDEAGQSSLWIAGTRVPNDDFPSCFVSRVPLGAPWSFDGTIESLESDSSWEACTSLSLGASPEGGGLGKAIVAGVSQRSTLLVNSTASYKGFTVDAYPAFGAVPLALLNNTLTSNPNAVTVPVGSVVRGNVRSDEGETTWIISVDLALTQEIANDIVTGSSRPMATSMSVHRWNQKVMQQQGLQQTFAGTWNNIPASIAPAGILAFQNGSLLIVAGTTNAQGTIFGTKRFGTGNDLDGFVLKLDGDRSEPWIGGDGDITSSHVIESVNEQEDRIEAICANEAADPNHFYVLGSTMGSIDGSTDPIILTKVNIRTLERLWTVRLGVNGNAQGTSCSVSNDGAEVYFSGVLFDGAILTSFGPASAFGGHDIFVAKATSGNGELVWSRQIGSEGNDVVSALVSNASDDGAIAIVHSDGQWFRQKSEINVDMIAFSISRQDGSHLPLLGSETFGAPVATPVAVPVAAPVVSQTSVPTLAPIVTNTVPIIVATPVAAAPVAVPVSSPVSAPFSFPVTALNPSPVAVPVAAPISSPVATPVSPPVDPPIAASESPTSSSSTTTPSTLSPTMTGGNQTESPSISPAGDVIDGVEAATTSSAKYPFFVKPFATAALVFCLLGC